MYHNVTDKIYMQEIKVLNTNGKIESWDLIELRDNLGIGEKDFKLLMEAYRRKNLLDRDKKILGIGTPKEYKSKFFKPLDKDNVKDKENNPFTLSQRGIEIIELIEKYLPKPTLKDSKEKLSKVITRF